MFINNNEALGTLYDFKLVQKEFNKLGCPRDVFNPFTLPIASGNNYVAIGERSTGKTTNILLIGMLLNKLYGTITAYIRQSNEMITPKNCRDLMTTIISCGYIEKITDGKYNSCFYHSSKWYYCLVDEDGEIIDKAPKYFMYCLSLDRSLFYKSVLNLPLCDWIVFDEFLGKAYQDDLYYFLDIVKTIARRRISPVLWFVSNTIEKNAEIFREMGINKEIQKIKPDQLIKVTAPSKMVIYIKWVQNCSKITEKINTAFFGYNSPKLAAITGNTDQWYSLPYQHIIPQEVVKTEPLIRNCYLLYNECLLNLEIVKSEKLGMCLYIHKASKLYPDSVIYTDLCFSEFIRSEFCRKYDYTINNYRYGLGNAKIDKWIHVDSINDNKHYYDSSDSSELYNSYRNKIMKGVVY